MRQEYVTIAPDSRAEFNNNAAFCVGTGRMDLALRRDYQEQLALVQREAGFRHIRGHGLFCDQMGIYQPYTDAQGVRHEGYCFTYLDQVMDAYRALGLRPFLELGFMPEKMASGAQTVFYWHGNVTPPDDMGRWVALVEATLGHLKARYGEAEVSAWPCEVWNEPNLVNFWEHADKEKYLALYEATALAVKRVLPRMAVGGPAVCGGPTSQEWIRDFLTFCRDRRLPVDFVTRHAYMGNTPQTQGRYLYHEMRTVDAVMAEIQETRAVIDSFPEYRGMPMHITEFNTSYNPFCPIHDTNLNAAYVAGLLARLGEVAASYSYWTFGDVFEENGVPATPFHGGFGMVANGLIPKPTLWTFAFFCGLQGQCVHRDEHLVLMRREDGSYEGVAWNLCRQAREALSLHLSLPAAGPLCLTIQTVDEACCNPLRLWHEMGEPAWLTAEQLRFLRQSAQPRCDARRVTPEGGMAAVDLTLAENAVVRFTLADAPMQTEYGYDYTWYQTHS